LWSGRLRKDDGHSAVCRRKIANFNIRGQLNCSKLDKKFANSKYYTDDDSLFFSVETDCKNNLFSLGTSYTKNNKKQPVYGLDSDNISFIKSQKQFIFIVA
jgi:hypothetical protein